MRMLKVISGGQTGVDRAALQVAKDLGMETGGFMPKGWLAQDGLHPEFRASFHMQEDPRAGYTSRTEKNVLLADVTVRIAYNFQSAGELATLRFITKHHKPYLDILWCKEGTFVVQGVDSLHDWLILQMDTFGPMTVNLAGNAERTAPGIYEASYFYLADEFLLATQ